MTESKDSYVKTWTSIYSDQWFLELPLNARGVWLQLFPLAKLKGDTGAIIWTSFRHAASEIGCDGSTVRKILRDFDKLGKVSLKVHRKSVLLEILNYHKYQQHKKAGASQACRKSAENSPPLSLDQLRPDQTRQKAGRVVEGIPYKKILDDLNQRTNRTGRSICKPTQPTHRVPINGRWGEGYRLEDFIHVNTVKSAEWMNTERERFLTPATLYGKKHFATYLSQKIQEIRQRDLSRPPM